MGEQVARFLLSIGHGQPDTLATHFTRVADLAAALAIERCLVHHHSAALALLELGYLLAVHHQRGNDALCALRLVTEKFRRADFLAQAEPDRFLRRLARSRPGCPRLRALTLHGVGEGSDIDRNPARTQRILREIKRKSIGVVERESSVAVEHRTLLEAFALLVEDGEAALEHAPEAGLLELEGLGDQGLRAEQLGVTHGTPHDAAQDVAAPFV